MTGIGPVGVRQPRVRDRGAPAEATERIRFTSTILPPYARRSKSLDVLLPILYLKGISTGDFAEALVALLGKDAPGLSASTISRLKEAWTDDHNRWKRRGSVGTPLRLHLGGWHLSAGAGSKTRSSASSFSSARRLRAGRSSSASRMGHARVRKTGASYCWISNAEASRSHQSSRLLMAGWVSGRPSARSGRRHRNNAAGCTRRRTSSTSCRRASSRKPSALAKRSGWPRRALTPWRPSTPSLKATG